MIGDGKRCEDVCKHAPPQKGKWPCCDCDMRYHDRAERKTNADRIRAMTDEQLAKFLEKVGGCGPSFDKEYCYNVNGCPDGSNCWLAWLQKEEENGVA